MSIDRRSFISTIAAAGASLTLNGLQGIGSMIGSTESKRKIHVFSKPLVWLGYEDLAALLYEAGAEGIDLTVRPGGNILPENVESDLPRAVEAARKKGLTVEMIVTGIVSADEKYAESIIRTASSLGVKFYRLGWINYDDNLGIAGTIRKFRSDLKKLEVLNRKYGIHGAYQNHSGTMVGAAVWDIYEAIEDLDPRFIGCQYDVRHAVVEGADSWPNGLKLIAQWIKCTDIKDFKWIETDRKWNPVSVPLGDGIVNFDEYFTLIKTLNISGPMSLHFEYPPFENEKETGAEADKKEIFIREIRRDIDRLKALRSKYLL
ncbi:MAG: sugar phosphate isomerase/epimerase family protein [Bacteroidales bacterium]